MGAALRTKGQEMALGFAVGDEMFAVGDPQLLHAFFSTVSYHTEPAGWGSRFPALLLELYQGELPAERIDAALQELTTARRELAALPATDLVWDIDLPGARPPAGREPGPGVPNLSRYFVAADGRPLFDVLALALIRLRMTRLPALRIAELVTASA